MVLLRMTEIYGVRRNRDAANDFAANDHTPVVAVVPAVQENAVQSP